jgi:hypothetical protein
MIPNYASAVILNNLILAYNQTLSTTPVSRSIVNYCLANNAEASLNLNYGLSIVNPNNSNHMNDMIVFGKGLCTTDLSTSLVEVPNANLNQFGFTLSDILDFSDEISNCYILGAAYLTSRNTGVTVEFSLAKPSANSAGENIIFSKDISLDYVKDILKYSTEIVFPEPTANPNYSFLLCKFIIDVEKFVDDYNKNRAFIKIIDERMPSGYFGLAEEKLYTTMIMNILQADTDINNTANVELNNIKQIVNTWVNLDSWSPSFVGYWVTADPAMPTELKDFIENQLGIII